MKRNCKDCGIQTGGADYCFKCLFKRTPKVRIMFLDFLEHRELDEDVKLFNKCSLKASCVSCSKARARTCFNKYNKKLNQEAD